MSKLSKATDISQRVKKIVWERDSACCIICNKHGYGVMPNSHYIRRSKGGLGIPENVGTMCIECHNAYDNGERREEIGLKFKEYLKSKYPNWNEEDLIYRK